MIVGSSCRDKAFRILISVFLFVIACGTARAAVGVDLRAADPLHASSQKAAYVLRISDCMELIEVRAGSAQGPVFYSPADIRRLSGDAGAGELEFALQGEGRLYPHVELTFLDGEVQNYSELFAAETNAPSVSFQSVSINPDGHDQRLNVTFQAADDTDISYVSVQATGLRVSDLRAAGGVITRARRQAFADTSGSVRIYPERDDQNTFDSLLLDRKHLSSFDIFSKVHRKSGRVFWCRREFRYQMCPNTSDNVQ